MGILVAFIVFSIIVFIHELGHYMFAKFNNILVEEFAIGMGPAVYKKKIGETVYSIRILPLGGFCKMLGEDGEVEEDQNADRAFGNQSVFARVQTIIAGPMMNFILAIVVFLIVGLFTGYQNLVIDDTNKMESSFMKNDEITTFNGKNIIIFDQLDKLKQEYINENLKTEFLIEKDNGESEQIIKNPSYQLESNKFTYNFNDDVKILSVDGQNIDEVDLEKLATNKVEKLENKNITIEVKRNNEIIKLNENLDYVKELDSWVLGVFSKVEKDFIGIINYSFKKVYVYTKWILEALKNLGKTGFDRVSGPIGIVKTIGDNYTETAKINLLSAVINSMYIMGVLSINLGLINLLPIPALDGGRLVFLIFEGIFKKKLASQIEAMIHFIGFIFLMGLMVFIFYADIVKIFF